MPSHSRDGLHAIVCSFDRPLQLEGFLHSLISQTRGDLSVTVIARVSTFRFFRAYRVVESGFRSRGVVFWFQLSRFGFRRALMEALGRSRYRWTSFFVDDNVVVRSIDLSDTVQLFDQGVFSQCFRFGKNIRRSVFSDVSVNHPRFFRAPNATPKDSILWRFGEGGGNWRYFGIEGSVLSTESYKNLLGGLQFSNPSQLELAIQTRLTQFSGRVFSAYTASRLINLPANSVQTEGENPINGFNETTTTLLDKFENGYRLDATWYAGQEYDALHIQLPLRLCKLQ